MTLQSIPAEEFKFGSFGLIDVKPCKARTKMLKHFEKKGVPIKVTIKAEIIDVHGGFDGIGQEFEIEVKKVKVKK